LLLEGQTLYTWKGIRNDPFGGKAVRRGSVRNGERSFKEFQFLISFYRKPEQSRVWESHFGKIRLPLKKNGNFTLPLARKKTAKNN